MAANRSKELAWLLRHGAPSVGITMDTAGWVAVADVLRHCKMTRAELEAVVADNNKQRFELDGARVRASQGHSEATPVTREGLEASWVPYAGDGPLWHGTTQAALPGIFEKGLISQARTHVHMAESPTSKVGKRANVEVLLVIDVPKLRAAGEGIWRSPNGVILARHVPPTCVLVSRTL
jgi:putative RNA 2'-phosphotransferase